MLLVSLISFLVPMTDEALVVGRIPELRVASDLLFDRPLRPHGRNYVRHTRLTHSHLLDLAGRCELRCILAWQCDSTSATPRHLDHSTAPRPLHGTSTTPQHLDHSTAPRPLHGTSATPRHLDHSTAPRLQSIYLPNYSPCHRVHLSDTSACRDRRSLARRRVVILIRVKLESNIATNNDNTGRGLGSISLYSRLFLLWANFALIACLSDSNAIHRVV